MAASKTSSAKKSRMQVRLETEVWPKVSEKFGIKNPMALPRLEKIVINTGVGKSLDGTKLKPEVRDTVLNSLSTITGQKAVLIQARKSVANFKLREGMTVAAMVTVRRDRMWSLFDRLINLTIPRVKDFRGLSDTAFDKAGNYAMGFSEQGVFPEIDMTKTNIIHGMHINLVFRNSNPEITKFVLQEMGWPFRKEEEKPKRKAS